MYVKSELSTEVIIAIAEAKGVEPNELEMPLSEYIDLEAIDTLAESESGSWKLWFELPEHTVTVTSDGWVLVDGKQEEIETTHPQ